MQQLCLFELGGTPTFFERILPLYNILDKDSLPNEERRYVFARACQTVVRGERDDKAIYYEFRLKSHADTHHFNKKSYFWPIPTAHGEQLKLPL